MRCPYLLPLIMVLLTGCARYEFDLVQPEELARHIGRTDQTAATVSRPPLEYRLQAAEGRLVMIITNSTDEVIELIGEESYVVDPAGQSHPLRSQSIAPHSFIKLIFPPMRPFYYRPGPTIGIGVGYSAWRDDGWPYSDVYGGAYHDVPYYLSVADENVYYWDWDGEGSIRMRLTFRRQNDTFHQEFVFQRQKV